MRVPAAACRFDSGSSQLIARKTKRRALGRGLVGRLVDRVSAGATPVPSGRRPPAAGSRGATVGGCTAATEQPHRLIPDQVCSACSSPHPQLLNSPRYRLQRYFLVLYFVCCCLPTLTSLVFILQLIPWFVSYQIK